MKLYGGIDLHSNNSVIALLDETDKVVYGPRLPNDLDSVLRALEPWQEAIEGLVVESTVVCRDKWGSRLMLNGLNSRHTV